MRYYSEKLDTLFDSVEDLQAAEKQVAETEAEKKKASEVKKAEAKKVEEAFKALNAAKRKYNTNVLELKKKYNEDLTVLREKLNDLRKAHENAVAAEAAERDEAENAYKAALDEFIANHPSGYHMTLKDGDYVVTLSSSTTESKDLVDQLFDLRSFWDDWMRIFRF